MQTDYIKELKDIFKHKATDKVLSVAHVVLIQLKFILITKIALIVYNIDYIVELEEKLDAALKRK